MSCQSTTTAIRHQSYIYHQDTRRYHLKKRSVRDHIINIISKSLQTPYTLTILRAHGLCDTALQSVYRPVVVARLLYACNAWWVFTTSADQQRLAGFVRRGVRRGFCSLDLINIDNLVSDMDDKLFYKNKHHVLHRE